VEVGVVTADGYEPVAEDRLDAAFDADGE